jgi:hypothetical protein
VYECFACRYVGVPCACKILEDRRGCEIPCKCVTDSCELPCGCWEQNPGPPKEQPVLSTTQPCLQPHNLLLNRGQAWLPASICGSCITKVILDYLKQTLVGGGGGISYTHKNKIKKVMPQTSIFQLLGNRS